MPPKSWGLRSVGAALVLATFFTGSFSLAASRTYKVRAGDTVSLIAARFGVSVKALEQANSLGSQGFIRQGEVLVIPLSPAATPSGRPHEITVEPGDTLTALAAEYDVSVLLLERWNHLTATSVLQVGQRLVVEPPSMLGPGRSASLAVGSDHYKVQAGDTLTSIAARFHVSIATLARANGLTGTSIIQIGQVLRIPGTADSGKSLANGHAVRAAARSYTVAPGDTLTSIAARYGLSVASLEAINNLGPTSVLKPGEHLWLFRPNGTGGNARPEAASPQAASIPVSLDTRIVEEAQKFLGVPYVWGGASPSGFDCSGLVQYVFGQLGISLPRTASQQYEVGTAVSRGALMPGDTVFFDTTGGVSHVGIYIGNDQFIDAPAPGQDVQVMNLGAPYWASRYLGARSYAGL